MLCKDLDCVSKIGRDTKSLKDRVRVKLAEMQKNCETIVLINIYIIFMIMNACLRIVKLKTGIHVHI